MQREAVNVKYMVVRSQYFACSKNGKGDFLGRIYFMKTLYEVGAACSREYALMCFLHRVYFGLYSALLVDMFQKAKDMCVCVHTVNLTASICYSPIVHQELQPTCTQSSSVHAFHGDHNSV